MSNRTFETKVNATDYMLRVAASSIGSAYKDLAFTQLRLEAGHTVIDLGCGPGADLERYGAAVGLTGSVVGFDHDETAVSDARQRTVNLPQVRLEQADIHRLDLPDGSVDAVHTVLCV